ncbi:hypothetical protein [Sinimarinibacterium flocculans]|uniref:hypothetical protein n=1 Tax=Sinimarinibacterium flocculans TaxID=985250 RepID=UPI00351868C1
MKVLGIRWCTVSGDAGAQAMFFDALGLPRKDLSAFGIATEPFAGAVFPAGESWIELWPAGPQMPEGTMLQVVVDDADAFAAHARANGLSPEGPMDAHGERIYMLKAPGGLQVSFQSRLPA